MLSSRNVIYGFTVAPENVDEEGEREKLVIDSNELAKQIILKQEIRNVPVMHFQKMFIL